MAYAVNLACTIVSDLVTIAHQKVLNLDINLLQLLNYVILIDINVMHLFTICDVGWLPISPATRPPRPPEVIPPATSPLEAIPPATSPPEAIPVHRK